MPRKRPKAKPGEGGSAKRKQYNVAFDTAFAARVDDTAEALGLDGTQLVRMIVRENIAKYEKRAAAVKDGRPPDE